MRRIRDANDAIVACVDSNGWVTIGPTGMSAPAGLIRSTGECFGDTAGADRLGYVDHDGHIYDDRYELVGKVDPLGRVFEEPSERVVGEVDDLVDAAALLLIVAKQTPSIVAPPAPPEEKPEGSLMEEALEQAEELKYPHVRHDYTRLPDRLPDSES